MHVIPNNRELVGWYNEIKMNLVEIIAMKWLKWTKTTRYSWVLNFSMTKATMLFSLF